VTANPQDPTGFDPTEVEVADIYKGGLLAGRLERAHSGTRFTYTEQWVNDHAAEPVAFTLPVTRTPVTRDGSSLPPFFAGLLPEGRRLSALQRSVKTSADDEFSMLLAVGSETIGDVQVVPTGHPAAPPAARVEVDDFADISFREVLAALDIDIDRSSVPGVQDKASLTMLSVPVARRGERHILKLNTAELPRVVENEYFFLTAARQSGLLAAEAEVVDDRDGQAGLVVRRFDRHSAPGTPGTLPVEDACQVLGLYPGDKYRVSTEDLINGLAARCSSPRQAALSLYTQVAFAYLTGNGDAHAKNFSIMRALNGLWVPTPAYDLPSTVPYKDNTMALPVGARKTEPIGPQQWTDLAVAVNLPARAARMALSELLNAVPTWVDGVTTLPFAADVLRTLRNTIERRTTHLRPPA
jgi:serine/threonine-protein kinase HipA